MKNRITAVAALSMLVVSAQAADSTLRPEPGHVIDFYNAKLGMPAAQVRALAPTGPGCTPEDDGQTFLLECGPYRMTARFTATGHTWGLRAAVDLTANPTTTETLRAMLQDRYGPAVVLDAGSSPTLVWLPMSNAPQMALRCFNEEGVIGAMIQSAQPGGPKPSSAPTPGCYPLRFAILANHGPNSGLILDITDPRPRLAELARRSTPPRPSVIPR